MVRTIRSATRRWCILGLLVMVAGCGRDSELPMGPAEKAAEALFTEDYPVAVQFYTEAIADSPDDVALYLNRGIAQFELKEYQAAVEDFDEVIRREPKLQSAYHHRSRAYEALGETQKAEEDRRMAEELSKSPAAPAAN